MGLETKQFSEEDDDEDEAGALAFGSNRLTTESEGERKKERGVIKKLTLMTCGVLRRKKDSV